MPEIIGQIESLKKLKSELSARGIDRFSSIKDINNFTASYEQQKRSLRQDAGNQLDLEITALQTQIKDLAAEEDQKKAAAEKEMELKEAALKANVDRSKTLSAKHFLNQIIHYLPLKNYERQLSSLRDNRQQIIAEKIRKTEDSINSCNRRLEYYLSDREEAIHEKAKPYLKELERIQETLHQLKPIIAGAIGEHKVVEEIKKWTGDYVLINDFNLSFDRPIYMKQSKDRIFSIQVDHLLISKAGLFILETKNWSKESIESLDLRSPIEQIQRTSHALFVLLNKGNVQLSKHHWGAKQVPIRNIIVMINSKPIGEFKFVKVKKLEELNGFVSFFDDALNSADVKKLAEYLSQLNHKKHKN